MVSKPCNTNQNPIKESFLFFVYFSISLKKGVFFSALLGCLTMQQLMYTRYVHKVWVLQKYIVAHASGVGYFIKSAARQQLSGSQDQSQRATAARRFW